MGYNLEDLPVKMQAQAKAKLGIGEKLKKASKYGNIKVVYDGKTFDSKKECRRYQDLELLLRAGEISDLRCQVPFLLAGGVRYIADFVYYDKEKNVVVEDAKGMQTDVYKLKKKLFKERYGFDILET